ncbi:hypothetical protein GCM10023350_01550 [Nocardioides endophyticus]|uniref:Uncharacterized protein n=1 Tax=Nocardioides endophyticus TaxID=1353775 RepID=A0ABP8Y9H2_9ACTN
MAGIGEDGSLLVTGRAGRRTLPAEYVELAFTTTAYGAQGETVGSAHLALGETTGAASAYVGMTRGRHHNTAHLVAESLDDARHQWVDVFNRDRADLGPRQPPRGPLTTSTGTDRVRRLLRPGCRPRSCEMVLGADPSRSRPPGRLPLGSVADQLPRDE